MKDMPKYEKIWMTVGIGSLIVFLVILGFMAFNMGLHPSGSLQTTAPPEEVSNHPPFDKPGLTQIGPNEYKATIVSFMFSYEPATITVPAGSTVHFEMTSKDVVHGYLVPGTNVNLMLIPGHVTNYTHTFDEPGEYLAVCHEYCGAGHQVMQASVIVEPST